jgi:hypothetical protein
MCHVQMAEYLTEVLWMEKFFDGFEVRCVPCLDNRDTNHLAWIASFRAPTPPDVIIEKLSKPSVKPTEAAIEAIKQDMHQIQGLSVLSEANHKSCKSSPAYQSLLAFCNLGNRHRGHSVRGTGRVQILICRH